MTNFYDQNAQTFFDATVNVELPALWGAFLAELPKHARILDAGCGSGRDAKYFGSLGHAVDAIDSSEAMCRRASEYIGIHVQRTRLQDLNVVGTYHGVWCCAAALHVPDAELDDVLARLHRALRSGGVCYLSFKLGTGERHDGARHFTDMTEEALRVRLRVLPGVNVVRLWTTHDARPDRADEQWLNALSSVT